MSRYPWPERHTFKRERRTANAFVKATRPLAIGGAVFSLSASAIAGSVIEASHKRAGGSWFKPGLAMIGVGLVLAVILGGPIEWIHALKVLFYSFGKYRTLPWSEALRNVFLSGLGTGLALQGFASMADCYKHQWQGNKFLEPVEPNRAMRRRMNKNTEQLESAATLGDGNIIFGVLIDDPLPWRTERYGMMCGRPIDGIGHGVVVGANGTGKTVFATNMLSQFASMKYGALYIDMKASHDTYMAAKNAAALAGVPFYSFDLGIGSGERSWLALLDYDAAPSDKASMLVQSFNFPDEGSASYYKNIAEMWLTLQIEVMERLGLNDGEGSFDFLLDTSNVAKLKDRIGKATRGASDRDQALARSWNDRIAGVKNDDLANLRANLSTVVHAGGDRLRPQPDMEAISFRRIASEGGVVYVGLSPSTNQVALKIIGSLTIRAVDVLSGERMRVRDKKQLQPVLCIIDEASRLGSRATVLENLFVSAREARVAVWVFTQSFSIWPDSTKKEMNTNVQNHVAFRTPDIETASMLVSTLPFAYNISETVQVAVEENSRGGTTSTYGGDASQRFEKVPLIEASTLTTLPNYQAYVWFTGNRDRATIEKWKSKIVKDEAVKMDAPLVRIVAPATSTDPEAHQVATDTVQVPEISPSPKKTAPVDYLDDSNVPDDADEWTPEWATDKTSNRGDDPGIKNVTGSFGSAPGPRNIAPGAPSRPTTPIGKDREPARNPFLDDVMPSSSWGVRDGSVSAAGVDDQWVPGPEPEHGLGEFPDDPRVVGDDTDGWADDTPTSEQPDTTDLTGSGDVGETPSVPGATKASDSDGTAQVGTVNTPGRALVDDAIDTADDPVRLGKVSLVREHSDAEAVTGSVPPGEQANRQQAGDGEVNGADSGNGYEPPADDSPTNVGNGISSPDAEPVQDVASEVDVTKPRKKTTKRKPSATDLWQ